ncbi:MAG: type II toxin-antitoxin system ParD family antitoxin [Terricaulis sp.]
MDGGKTITVTLPSDLVDGLDAAVRAGDYTSRDEAVRVGLEMLEADRMIEALGIERVRQMWRQGVESGPGRDAEEVFARLIAKYERVAQERGE